ncbi:MAG TPA: prolyl oligopeptidase family serine peptidase [Tepidisphaeraceae bacterium]|nr:prolyl oligopeptidase family serine peptidase [Tepidisphaeraceae bacterium]
MVLTFACGGCRGDGGGVARSTGNFPVGAGFSRHQILVEGKPQTLWVFVPKHYEPKHKYPTILFLHGLFEAGDGNGNKCLAGGLAPVIAKQAEDWPFITIFPQSDGNWKGEEHDQIAMAALDFTAAHWSIDQDRVILAGLSYGGLGTWEIGANHPDRFAALVPISGLSAPDHVERLANLPIWAFAYSGDPWVSSRDSESMCQSIHDRGGNARLTEFIGIGHDCSEQAINDSQLVDWMLHQRRGVMPARPVNPAPTISVAHVE